MTVHPSDLAYWIANWPIPPAPPCTRKVSPLASPTWSMLEMTVAVTSMSVDAVTGSMPSGMGRSWPAGTMTYSA